MILTDTVGVTIPCQGRRASLHMRYHGQERDQCSTDIFPVLIALLQRQAHGAVVHNEANVSQHE